jgi:nitrate reductase beta subunit
MWKPNPALGYPKDWENQRPLAGGLGHGVRMAPSGHVSVASWRVIGNLFSNPDMPAIEDYYEPWDYDYATLQTAPRIQNHASGAALFTGLRPDDGQGGMGA